MQKELDLDKELLLEIIEHLNDAIYITNQDGVVVYVNPGAEVLEHLSADEMLGKTVSEIYNYTELRMEKNAPSLNVLKSGISQVEENIEWFTKEGIGVNAITSSYPINRDGKTRGVFSISQDISTMKERLINVGAFGKKDTYRLRKKIMRNGTVYIFDDIIGKSESMQSAINVAKRFAGKKLPVMIYGETGTGKEMFAQSIHNASHFMAGNFVPINCAAIPENLLESMLFGTVKGAFTGAIDSVGYFEKAEKGTIFLDEINSMPITLQAKILRVLQEKEVQRIGDSKTRKINCRIISATNKLPVDAIRAGELREDLFYRLSTGMIFVPSLKERGHDLELLIQHLIDKSNHELNIFIDNISTSLRALLQSYYWPGNIRELSNTIESAMNMTLEGETVLDVHHLPSYLKTHFKKEISAMPNAMQVFAHGDYVSHPIKNYEQYPVMDFHGDLSGMVGQYEKNILEIALASTSGNLTRCGEKLGITRQGLMKKVVKYHINLDKYKPSK